MSNQQEVLSALQQHAPEGVTVEPSQKQGFKANPDELHFDVARNNDKRSLVINKDTWDNLNSGLDTASRIADLLKGLFG